MRLVSMCVELACWMVNLFCITEQQARYIMPMQAQVQDDPGFMIGNKSHGIYS